MLAGLARIYAGSAAGLRPAGTKVLGSGHAAAHELPLQPVPLFAESWLLAVIHLRTREVIVKTPALTRVYDLVEGRVCRYFNYPFGCSRAPPCIKVNGHASTGMP